VQVLTAADDPALSERTAGFDAVWPEYNRHGTVIGRYWSRLGSAFASSQFALLDEEGDGIAVAGHAAPLAWDGTVGGLPAGIDGAIETAFAQRERGVAPTALCALAVQVRQDRQGRGLSRAALEAMLALAAAQGLADLIAPVRPSAKEQYPFTPIEAYAMWAREDGLPLDPWMRVHARLGATILRPEPRSLLIEASVDDWERWTGMVFPTSGRYWFPSGLAPLSVDREAGVGTYYEPNVWMRHAIAR
jgi:GNAT superfamily N-acetyltransferase